MNYIDIILLERAESYNSIIVSAANWFTMVVRSTFHAGANSEHVRRSVYNGICFSWDIENSGRQMAITYIETVLKMNDDRPELSVS